jgi:hypothetical protein
VTTWRNRNRSLTDPTAFQRAVLTDAWLHGNAIYWERRARQLEAALPRPGDYPGRATPAERAARARRITEAAHACRNRAAFIEASIAELDASMADLNQEPAA